MNSLNCNSSDEESTRGRIYKNNTIKFPTWKTDTITSVQLKRESRKTNKNLPVVLFCKEKEKELIKNNRCRFDVELWPVKVYM